MRKLIVSAHSMDTVFYAMDDRGYLYECWSGEEGAVPAGAEYEIEDPPNRIGRMNLETVVESVNSILEDKIDICGNSYYYKVTSESKIKVSSTPLGDMDLPVFESNFLLVEHDKSAVYSNCLDDYLFKRLVNDISGGDVYKIKKFKEIFDRNLDKYQIGVYENSIEHTENIINRPHILFWGFKNIAPAPLFLTIPEFFNESIYSVQPLDIPVDIETARPVLSIFKNYQPLKINKVFKESIQEFLTKNK